MASPRLSATPQRIKLDLCPICRIGVDYLDHHLESRHPAVIRMGDIFWIDGVKEAIYSKRHYKADPRAIR